MARLVFAFFLLGCSGSPQATDAGVDAGPVDASAEASPAGPTTFIMRRMFAGDSDRAFKPSATAWQAFGDDIDGKTTTASSTDVCQRYGGAPASIQQDGEGGIDNSFGANVIPALIAAGFPSPSLQWSQATTQAAVRAGLITVSDSGVEMRLGAIPPGPIAFDGTGVWPVSSLSVTAAAPNVRWTSGVTTGAIATPRIDAQAILTLPQNMGTLVLRIHRVAVRGSLADGKTMKDGVLSGVLYTSELLQAVKQVIGANKSVCSGPMVDSLTNAISSAQDILDDGTQDPSRPCNAISIGLGFDGTIVKLGEVQDDKGPEMPCP
jgi:hypothetical protein